mgnify:CR=1 FL=1
MLPPDAALAPLPQEEVSRVCLLSIGAPTTTFYAQVFPAYFGDLSLQRTHERLAAGTGVLATIGSTAPFVGLFGTVWGIMNSFIGISEAQTTNLAVVAPGIAEALLATAIGLVAAIPAVVIYNHLTRSIAGYRALLGDASVMVMLLVSREGDRSLFRLARAAE